MDVKQLESFLAIVEHGSLSKAAEKLRVSASTVSGHLSQLEAELGTPLLMRQPRGMLPTNAGQVLHLGARTVFLVMEQVRHNVAAAATDVAGLVRVCLPTSPATILSLPLAKSLQERHPSIRLELFAGFSGHLEEMLTQKRYDIGLLYRSSPIKGLIVEPLVDEDLVLVGGFEPGNRDEVALAEVADLRFVLPSRKHGLRQLVDRAFDAQGVQPEIIAELDTLPAIREAAFSGFAATILSMSGTGFQVGKPYAASLRRIVNPTITRTVALCRLENTLEEPVATITAGLLAELTRQAVLSGAWGNARLRT